MTPTPDPQAAPEPSDTLSVRHHTVTIGGHELHYTVTTGTLILKQETTGTGDKAGITEGEKPKASLFFVAYTKDDVPNPARRPLTFSFNGGPGSSSVWMHLGLLGPRRVLMDDTGHPTPPPYQLVDNEHSLLDATDLVFLDPVGTGYSRALPGEKPADFHDYHTDIASVGDFIRLYTSRNQRWTSPKFLIGESYGTTRAAGLSGYLQDRHGMYLNGIMLISSILNFQTALLKPGNDLPAVLFLPSYAATAHYHQRLPEHYQRLPLSELLAEVEAFAASDYTLALMRGSELPPEEARALAARLAAYTGLSETYVLQSNLRLDIHRYVKELLRDQHRTIGRLDSRFTGIDRDAAGEHHEYDPSYATIQGPYTATFNQYVQDELGYQNDLPYEILTSLHETWSYKAFQNEYVNASDTLRKAMTTNPHLKLHVASGYFDLATPYYATDYTLRHLGLDPQLQANITTSTYEAGHMMYVHAESLAKLKRELKAFVEGAAPASP